MKIYEKYGELPLLKQNQYTCIKRDGSEAEEENPLLVEHTLTVWADGRTVTEFVCTPQHLSELVFGHLYTEGQIDGTEDIDSISVSEDGKNIEIHPVNGMEKRQLKPVHPIHWENDWIFHLADRFAEGMPLHRQTWATHSCFLARKGQILFECEDIGRHNAFDKTVGYALRHGIDLTECILYTSGRMPVDMVKKAIMSGIPVLAAKAVPTAESIRIAETYGLTLIGAARRDQMRIFTNPIEKIVK